MKKVIFFVLLLSLPFGEGWGGAFAQTNLVPNPSFEDTVGCPMDLAGNFFQPDFFNALANWINPYYGTPDYFNACAPFNAPGNVDVPCNDPYWGWQYARTGGAYAGIINGFPPPSGSTAGGGREYIQNQLTMDLISNHSYCVEFYVNRANNYYHSSNNIGIYFSDIPITSTVPLGWLPFPGIVPTINDTTVITDTVNWVKISGKFIAQGGERYITIGNFFPTQATTFIADITPYYDGAYYYIDDVSVIDCTEQGLEEENPWQGQCTVYPNPASESITVDVFGVRQGTYAYDARIESLNIYNALGAVVLKQTKPLQARPGECKVNIKDLVQGVYFVEVRIKDSENKEAVMWRKVVKQ